MNIFLLDWLCTESPRDFNQCSVSNLYINALSVTSSLLKRYLFCYVMVMMSLQYKDVFNVHSAICIYLCFTGLTHSEVTIVIRFTVCDVSHVRLTHRFKKQGAVGGDLQPSSPPSGRKFVIAGQTYLKFGAKVARPTNLKCLVCFKA